MSGTTIAVAACIASLAAYAVAWCLAVGSTLLARRAGRRRPPTETDGIGVSILKPLCGSDEEL